MPTWESYDAVLTVIYGAGAGDAPVVEMLARIRRLFGAASAGLSIYDDQGLEISHTVFSPARTISEHNRALVRTIYDDPAVRILTRPFLSTPKRFTDLVPSMRMRHARWFRTQIDLSAVGYGIGVDLRLGRLRVRLFAMRSTGLADFDDHHVELLGCVARHVERAFAANAQRLAPSRLGDQESLLFHRGSRDPGGFATGASALERRLSDRYHLTRAEARAVTVMAEVRDRAAAAARLGIAQNTLKTHLRRSYAKLGIRNLGDLVAIVHDDRFGLDRARPI